ncbi:YesL family protein [Neobacillus driksii]|uniref:YesL family protein n=1 Tax=Neobacillus driksii TaxID=3035913 RepID=UPI0035936525
MSNHCICEYSLDLIYLDCLIVFGFFPATIAKFTVIRKWVLKQPDIQYLKLFDLLIKKNLSKVIKKKRTVRIVLFLINGITLV